MKKKKGTKTRHARLIFFLSLVKRGMRASSGAREKRSRKVRVAHDDVSSSTYACAVLVFDVRRNEVSKKVSVAVEL